MTDEHSVSTVGERLALRNEERALEHETRPPAPPPAAPARRPVLFEPTVLISLLALLFSFGTTAVSFQRTEQEDIHETRTELRTLIQRLAVIPREEIEATRTQDAVTAAQLLGTLNQERITLANQAAEALRRIPNHAASNEYRAVAHALSIAGDPDGAVDFVKKAVESAKTALDEVAARQMFGAMLFTSGKPEEGRAQYREALEVWTRFPSQFPQNVTFVNAYTQLFWGQSELGSRFCQRASDRLDLAQGSAERLLPSAQRETLRQQIAAMRAALLSCRPDDPSPSPGGSPATSPGTSTFAPPADAPAGASAPTGPSPAPPLATSAVSPGSFPTLAP